MNSLPQPLWAILLALQGTGLAVVCLFTHDVKENIILGVLAIASNLVSGALGAFAGHAAAKSELKDQTTNPS